MSSTLYDILEVIPTASQETIHAAYRSLISRFHPDKMAGLGGEFQTIADARTKEINHAYDILGDAARRARYDEELRWEEEDPRALPTPHNPAPKSQPASPRKSPAAKKGTAARRTAAAGAAASTPSERHAFATLSAAAAGIVLVLTLPQAANVIFSAVEFSLTGHARYFYEADNPVDAKAGDSDSAYAYLLVLWGWLFANYLFGLVSYRLAVAAGELAAARSGGSFAATNDRLFLFLTLVCVVATGLLLFSPHTMGNVLAGMFILAGAYLSERGTG